MNLLAKRYSIKSILKPGLMMLIPVFFGCDTNEDAGIQYELDSNANVRFVEFTLPSTNIYIDSLRTDGENRVLVGNYVDPLTGTLAAEGYIEYLYEEGPLPRGERDANTIFPDTLSYDSILIILESDEIIPLRGSSNQSFDFYELQDTLVSSAIYLSSLRQTTSEQIGTYSRTINNITDTIFTIRLDDQFGQRIFDQISEIASDTTQFISLSSFKNLGILPGVSSESVSSLLLNSDTSRLILYTSPVSADSPDTTYLTYFQFSGKNYSYLERDFTGSSFDGIDANPNQDFGLPSGETLNDIIYGIKTTFDISEVESFFSENDNILINSAEFRYQFEAENNRDTLDTFYSFFRKDDGSIYGPGIVDNSFLSLILNDNTYLSGQYNSTSSPSRAFLDEDNLTYDQNATLFFQQLYNGFNAADSLAFPNPFDRDERVPVSAFVNISPIDVTLQRSIFSRDGIKLRIYYTEVDN